VVTYEQFVGFLGVQLTSVLYTVRVQDPVTPDMELEPDTKVFKKEIDKMNIQGKQYQATAYRMKSLYSVSLSASFYHAESVCFKSVIQSGHSLFLSKIKIHR
jgi:hypothetical protein